MLSLITRRINCPSMALTKFREMSVYPKTFVEPVISKEQQAELRRTGEFQKFNHIPVKAAKNNESTSVFYHPLVSKMANYIMKGGNKALARELLEKSFEVIKRRQIERLHLSPENEKDSIITNPEELLVKAIENSRPLLQLTAIKRGGVKYQVPVPVAESRSYFLAMNWLLDAAREKEKTVHLPEKLAWEIIDAAHGQGRVIKRKNDLHRQCEANRAYAHYRWS